MALMEQNRGKRRDERWDRQGRQMWMRQSNKRDGEGGKREGKDREMTGKGEGLERERERERARERERERGGEKTKREERERERER